MRHSATAKRIIARTNEIKIGGRYFLSSFYDKDGAWVTVLSKSTKINQAGWPSSVNIEVIASVGDHDSDYYKAGSKHTVNATNLYEKQEHASPEYKYGKHDKAAELSRSDVAGIKAERGGVL
jgi:hypothetical protein